MFEFRSKGLVLDFNDSPQMGATFEALVSDEAQGSLPWLAALEDPQLASAIDTMLQQPEQPHTVELLAANSSSLPTSKPGHRTLEKQ